jgi:hypothetical protein
MRADPRRGGGGPGGQVVDLMAALNASVAKASESRGEGPPRRRRADGPGPPGAPLGRLGSRARPHTVAVPAAPRPSLRPSRTDRKASRHQEQTTDVATVDGQVPQDPGEAGDVVAGIGHDDDVRVAGLPLACCDEPFDDFSELFSGDCGDVVGRPQADCVQDRGPGRGARFQHRDERVRPAGDELRGRLRAAVDVAEQPVRRARRV